MVTFSTVELDYLKILVKHIMASETKEITQTFALNRIGDLNPKKLTQQEAEKVLHKYNDHQWLRFSDDKPNIRLSTRFVTEMEPYLRDVYKDIIVDCAFCHKLVIQSIKCENCDTYYHLYCVMACADRASDNNVKCKECKTHDLPKSLDQSRLSSSQNRPRVGRKRFMSGLDSDSDSD